MTTVPLINDAVAAEHVGHHNTNAHRGLANITNANGGLAMRTNVGDADQEWYQCNH